jgi:hypothetical protein
LVWTVQRHPWNKEQAPCLCTISSPFYLHQVHQDNWNICCTSLPTDM